MVFVLSLYPLTFWPGILHWSCAQWCSVVRKVLNYVLFCVLKRRVSTAKRLVHGWFMVMKSGYSYLLDNCCFHSYGGYVPWSKHDLSSHVFPYRNGDRTVGHQSHWMMSIPQIKYVLTMAHTMWSTDGYTMIYHIWWIMSYLLVNWQNWQRIGKSAIYRWFTCKSGGSGIPVLLN